MQKLLKDKRLRKLYVSPKNYLSEEVMNKYFITLLDHIKYVIEAGQMIGIHKDNLKNHDKSKFSEEEFFAYAQFFQGTTKNKEEFDKAWLHHIHYNPHHWQYWMIPAGQVLEMPEYCIREMVADWLGASKAYTGSWNMTEWLEKNLSKIVLHPKSFSYLWECLSILGYTKYTDGKISQDRGEE